MRTKRAENRAVPRAVRRAAAWTRSWLSNPRGSTSKKRAPLSPAPLPRRTLAAAIDIALQLSLTWALRRRRGRQAGRRDALGSSEPPWMRVAGPSSELVREQIRTPGQRLLGLRTVDRRTGERLAAWRSLLLAAIRLAGGMLGMRAARAGASPERMLERERFVREWQAIGERYADSPDARQAARKELASQRAASGCIWQLAALAVLQAVLRRRVAPTIEISVRAPGERSRVPPRVRRSAR